MARSRIHAAHAGTVTQGALRLLRRHFAGHEQKQMRKYVPRSRRKLSDRVGMETVP